MDFPKRVGGPGRESWTVELSKRRGKQNKLHCPQSHAFAVIAQLLFFVDEQKVVFVNAKPNAGNKLALDCTTQQEAGGGF